MRDMIADLVAAVLPIIISTITAYGAVLARQWLNIQADSEAAQAINRAAERAAAVAYQQAARMGVDVRDEATICALVRDATAQAETRVAGAMQRRGVAHHEMAAMVRADFARWAAVDPTVPGLRAADKE